MQLNAFFQRNRLDEEFRSALREMDRAFQRDFVALGTVQGSTTRNPSAVAYTRLKEMKSGKREALDAKRYVTCKMCGLGVSVAVLYCSICKRDLPRPLRL